MVNKLLAAVIVLGIAIILSLVISAVFISRDAPELAIAVDWTPRPTATVGPVSLADPLPTEHTGPAISPTIGAELKTSCVHSVTYWAQHPELWPELVNISGFAYSKETMQMVLSAPTRDLSGDLLIQLHAAYLNTLQTQAYPFVSQAIIEAAEWINAHPADSEIDAEEQKTAISLGTILAEYNHGNLGYDLCIGDPSPGPDDVFNPLHGDAPSTTSLFTSTAITSLTKTPAFTPTASLTKAPASTPVLLPTFTPTLKERRPREQPGVTPTTPPAPAPTLTPISPNPTQAPLPTPAPTQIPLPTPAP